MQQPIRYINMEWGGNSFYQTIRKGGIGCAFDWPFNLIFSSQNLLSFMDIQIYFFFFQNNGGLTIFNSKLLFQKYDGNFTIIACQPLCKQLLTNLVLFSLAGDAVRPWGSAGCELDPDQQVEGVVMEYVGLQPVDGVKLINYFHIYMSSSEQSPEAFSDRLTKHYSCFCDKFFTTYPGIYLHLKSKHANLFQKYKKLKITKLFKKVKDENGSEIYKLERLSDKEASSNNFSQKKIKENKKRRIEEFEEKSSAVGEQEVKMSGKNSINKNQNHAQFFQHLPINPPYPLPSQPKEFNQKIPSNPYFPPMPHPYFGFPYSQPFPPFPPQPYPTQIHPLFSIKKLMKWFLNQAEQQIIQNKRQLKETLYQLMIFIDKNSDYIDDPRTKEKMIFSYCDEFEPKYLGPLLAECLSLKEEAMMQSDGQEQECRMREIGYLKQFIECIKRMGLLDQSPQKKSERQETELSSSAKEGNLPMVLLEE